MKEILRIGFLALAIMLVAISGPIPMMGKLTR